MRDKAIQLRKMLKDRNAQLQCDTQIKESQKYIDYFTEEMLKLQNRSELERSSPSNSPQSPTAATVPPRSSSKPLGEGEKKRETNLGKVTLSILTCQQSSVLIKSSYIYSFSHVIYRIAKIRYTYQQG